MQTWTRSPLPILPRDAIKVACSQCNLHEICLPLGLTERELDQVDTLVMARRTIARGDAVFRAGTRFSGLYAVRSGFFKTRSISDDGRDHVTGFQMAGELLGLDGIATGEHGCDAIALEDSTVCPIPYDRLDSIAREVPGLHLGLHKIMSREIVRDHAVMQLLAGKRAEERVAAFLLSLSQRLRQRGWSPSSFLLRMTREEIGSYLGLTLETVSRTFSKLHEDGILEVKQRQVDILDEERLRHVARPGAD
ncbi:MAG: fumarate/nitrate reduction transcriptional regulator Fnr [Burkholderiales bacterium]|jgi:CRP/FNR family transcriptional regulator, anaerobic regulatory protein|nr:fumarate/nitrate reduction transcriptional regulator Fnr [Burkholderiales bacterium]